MRFDLSQKRRQIKPRSKALMLTSMMDIFIIILIFLLKSYSATEQIMTVDRDLELPISTSQIVPRPATTIKITKKAIVIEDVEVAKVSDVLAQEEEAIGMLYDELSYIMEKAKFIEKENVEFKFEGEVTIQGDRQIPFKLLKRVMYTSSLAGFGNIALAVIQQE